MSEAPYLGPEGGRPGRPTRAVRHTCSGNLGIVKILRYIRSDICTLRKSIVKTNLAGRWAPWPTGALCLSTLKHNGKSGTAYGGHIC